jgi:hypothetical protein
MAVLNAQSWRRATEGSHRNIAPLVAGALLVLLLVGVAFVWLGY